MDVCQNMHCSRLSPCLSRCVVDATLFTNCSARDFSADTFTFLAVLVWIQRSVLCRVLRSSKPAACSRRISSSNAQPCLFLIRLEKEAVVPSSAVVGGGGGVAAARATANSATRSLSRLGAAAPPASRPRSGGWVAETMQRACALGHPAAVTELNTLFRLGGRHHASGSSAWGNKIRGCSSVAIFMPPSHPVHACACM